MARYLLNNHGHNRKMEEKNIVIKGARVNNLKNVDISLPLNKFIVVTGVSGSGKSSLAFDTLYAEGQRRYVESLSAYARQSMMADSSLAACPNLNAIISKDCRRQ